MENSKNSPFETNDYLNNGICNLLKTILIRDTNISKLEIDKTMVFSHIVSKWATGFIDNTINITVRVFTNEKKYDGWVDVNLMYGDSLNKLSPSSLRNIKKEIDPILCELVEHINKERKIKSLINKL